MVLSDININETLEKMRLDLEREDNLSPALKASKELLILIVSLLSKQLGLFRLRIRGVNNLSGGLFDNRVLFP